MDDHDEMLGRPAAVDRVREQRAAVIDGRSTRSVALDGIAGHIVAETIVADADVPPYSYATMDGFAFDATDDYPLDVVDEVFPEDEPPAIDPGTAVRIATGAPLPEGANAVLMRERSEIEDGQLRGETIEPGTYVYARGSNVSAGETLFEPGDRLSPKDAILLRDIGIESVVVVEPFSVGVLATGTEIHEGRSADLDSPMLAGLVRSWGHDATYAGTVPDEYDRVEDRIATLAATHDVVVTTGGTSVGRKDYVVRALDALGDVRFHGVRVRPGKPIAVAALPEYDAVAFAIPGKPVGAHTITTLIARPFFVGDTPLPSVEASLARDVDIGREGFEYAVPVTLDGDTAMPLGHVDSPLPIYDRTFNSSVLSQSTRATRADGFFLLTENTPADTPISVIPYPVVE